MKHVGEKARQSLPQMQRPGDISTVTGFFRLHNLTGSSGSVKTAKVVNGKSVVFEPDSHELLKGTITLGLAQKDKMGKSSSRHTSEQPRM